MYYSAKQGGALPVQSITVGGYDATLATLNLPSGTFLINATVSLSSTTQTASQVGCIITPAFGTGGPQTSIGSSATIPVAYSGSVGSITLVVQGVEVNQASVSLVCDAYGYADVNVGGVTIVATQQGSVVLQ
jgi:hypothetical protein